MWQEECGEEAEADGWRHDPSGQTNDCDYIPIVRALIYIAGGKRTVVMGCRYPNIMEKGKSITVGYSAGPGSYYAFLFEKKWSSENEIGPAIMSLHTVELTMLNSS